MTEVFRTYSEPESEYRAIPEKILAVRVAFAHNHTVNLLNN